MEARLQPLDFRVGVGWCLQELEEKAREHMVSALCILTNILIISHCHFTEHHSVLISTLSLSSRVSRFESLSRDQLL